MSFLAGLLVGGATADPAPEPSAAATPSQFVPLSPTRVLDTRNGHGGVTGPVGPRQTITVGLGSGLPEGATAAVLNLTGVAPTRATYVTVHSPDVLRPATSNLNLAQGEIRANLVTVAVSSGAVSLYNHVGDTHLVADLAGYYTTSDASRYTGRDPERVLSTEIGPGAVTQLDLSGRVPDSATAVVINVTGTRGTRDTYLTAWPSGTRRPVASTVNLARGTTNPNLATVALGADGRVSIYNHSGTIDVLVDLAGFYSPRFGASFVPVTPVRVFDSRTGTGVGWPGQTPLGRANTPVEPGAHIPDDAVAALVNMTGLQATATTHVTAYQALFGATEPTTSNLNLVPGQIAANLAAVTLRHQRPDTRFVVYNNTGTVHVAMDLAGYFVVPPQDCVVDCAIVWGGNLGGLGVGTTTDRVPTPTPVHGLSGVVDVADRYAVLSDGSVAAWGLNQHGQLGGGWRGGASPVPVPVSGITDAVAVGDTSSNGLALRADGTVWAWGANGSGILGESPRPDSAAPVRVAGLSGITAISGGNATAYALREDGTVLAWGANRYGQLGDGSTVMDSGTPVLVSGLTDVVSVAAGTTSGYAVRADGSLWAWGANGERQLGHDDEDVSRVPVRVTGLTNVVDVSADGQHGYAVLADGTAWAWGNGRYGALGDGTHCECRVATPVQVSSLTDVVDISAFGWGALALDVDGQVWVWGGNGAGEHGDGTVDPGPGYSTMPIKVSLVGQPRVGSLEKGTNGPRILVPLNDSSGGQR